MKSFMMRTLRKRTTCLPVKVLLSTHSTFICIVYICIPSNSLRKQSLSEEDINEDIEFDEPECTFVPEPVTVDPYDHVYSNIPQSTHMLESQKNCKHCGAKKFMHESK